ncbi:MAG TPA: hypothetical protein VFH51_00630 [Myxococcota bacterium]|nr:hypothetical protein [Myxococcota bacterium]
MNQLSPLALNPFEPYQQAQRSRRRWQVLCGVLASVVAAQWGYIVMRAERVIIKDRIHGAPPVVARAEADPPITVDDARGFFLNMLKLRHGWDSMTVIRDLDAYASQCISEQRAFERAYLGELVAPDAEAPEKKVPRKQHWVTAQIKNTLVLPDALDDVHCQAVQGGTWNCYVKATVVTQKLFPPYLPVPAQKRSAFVANLLPVRHTIDTPSGLVVGILRELPADEKGS